MFYCMNCITLSFPSMLLGSCAKLILHAIILIKQTHLSCSKVLLEFNCQVQWKCTNHIQHTHLYTLDSVLQNIFYFCNRVNLVIMRFQFEFIQLNLPFIFSFSIWFNIFFQIHRKLSLRPDFEFSNIQFEAKVKAHLILCRPSHPLLV